MNERIKELLNEAGRYAYEQNPGENSYGRPADENKYNQDRDTKFAELIVRECTNMLPEDSVRDPNGVHMFYVIRKHFGVSEIGR